MLPDSRQVCPRQCSFQYNLADKCGLVAVGMPTGRNDTAVIEHAIAAGVFKVTNSTCEFGREPSQGTGRLDKLTTYSVMQKRRRFALCQNRTLAITAYTVAYHDIASHLLNSVFGTMSAIWFSAMHCLKTCSL